MINFQISLPISTNVISVIITFAKYISHIINQIVYHFAKRGHNRSEKIGIIGVVRSQARLPENDGASTSHDVRAKSKRNSENDKEKRPRKGKRVSRASGPHQYAKCETQGGRVGAPLCPPFPRLGNRTRRSDAAPVELKPPCWSHRFPLPRQRTLRFALRLFVRESHRRCDSEALSYAEHACPRVVTCVLSGCLHPASPPPHVV